MWEGVSDSSQCSVLPEKFKCFMDPITNSLMALAAGKADL